MRTSVPPSTERPIRTSPPVDSATRRTMSSPSPVEPVAAAHPLPPRASAASGSAMPAPASETSTITASLAVVHVDGEGGALRGVPEDVAEQRIECGDEFGAGRRGCVPDGPLPRARTSRPSSSASADQKSIRSRITSEASQPAPGPVAGGLRLGVAGGADDRVDLALQLLDGGPGLLGGRALAERGGVEPQHGERGAQPVREVGGQFPFVGEELDDLVGHGVERDGGGPQFRRPLLADPGPELALPQVVGGAREPLGGLHHPYAEPVGDRDRADDQRDADARQHQPGGGDPVGLTSPSGTNTSTTAMLPGAQRGRLEQRGAAGDLGDRGAARACVRSRTSLRGGAPGADLHRPAVRLLGGGDVDGHPALAARLGGERRPVSSSVAVGGDGEGRADRGGLPLGVGEGPVAGHLLDDEAERYGEGDDDHRGDGQADLDQGPSHTRPLRVGSLHRGRLQLHADAAQGVQIARPGRRLAQLPAQPGQMDVDGLVVAVRLLPDLGEQFLARARRPRAARRGRSAGRTRGG